MLKLMAPEHDVGHCVKQPKCCLKNAVKPIKQKTNKQKTPLSFKCPNK